MRYLFMIIFSANVAIACEDPKISEDLLKKGKLPGVSCATILKVADLIKNPPKGSAGKQLFKKSDNSGEFTLSPEFCNDPQWKDLLISVEKIEDMSLRKLEKASILEEAEEYSARDAVIKSPEIVLCK